MSKYTGTEIAVIGMSCQVPGAENKDEFWNNLENGIESISFLSDEELLAGGVSKNQINNPSYVKANSFITNKEYFDSTFFGYRPSEAKIMDPQLRLFHENCSRALDDAGYGNENRDNKIGLFAGSGVNLNWINYALLSNDGNDVDHFTASQLYNTEFLCSRISYALNLQGPSVYINTACSTSLVGIQKASMSLLLRECNMALAGGIRINNYSHRGYMYQNGMIGSDDGHCRPFDKEANGTISGEGVGVVVLKRLADAIRDRDNIYAIIKGSGLNNDGNDKMSYAAPSVNGQFKAIEKAISMAKIDPLSISYVEAHGTATNLGDPIEIEALNLAYGENKELKCAIGSVKSNIGHLDTAAGAVGFIKAVLALKNKHIPASLNYNVPNPKINFHNSRFYVNTEYKKWSVKNYPLRSGVSSFGIGGTNVHVILEEAPNINQSIESRDAHLILLSGKSKSALQRNIENLSDFLNSENELNISDIAYTLQVGRSHFDYRKMVVCEDKGQAVRMLSSSKKEVESKVNSVKEKNKIIFMFPGQGSQYLNMCIDLYNSEFTFQKEIDLCFDIVKHNSGKDLKSIIFSEKSENKALYETEFTQPLLFIFEYALAKLLNKWGIEPDVMIGHSVGEYVAACISGVISLKDALSLVVKRGELMQRVTTGKMLAISISQEELSPILTEYHDLSLAAVNGPGLCVVSGKSESIELFDKCISSKGYTSKLLKTSHAFHSEMMDEILNDFEKEVNLVDFKNQQIPFISNLTGKAVTNSEIKDSKYWVNQLRNTVKFSAGIEGLLKSEDGIFIEVGPGKTLTNLLKSYKEFCGNWSVVNTVRHPLEKGNDLHYILLALGGLWEKGVKINWKNYYSEESRNRVSLPSYSFDKIKYPTIVDSYKMISEMISDKSTTKLNDIKEWFYTPTWTNLPLIHKDQGEELDLYNLVFVDNLGICNGLIEEIKKRNEKVITVQIGNKFTRDLPTSFIINPENDEDYEKLCKILLDDNLLPERIIHGWSITELVESELTESEIKKFINTSFYSLHNFIKISQRYGGMAGKHIYCLSNDLHNIIEKKSTSPVKSLILGLLKVIPQEFPTATCNHIDVTLSQEDTEGLSKSLYNEIMHSQNGTLVSIRESQRWIQTYNKLDVENVNNSNNFREQGVYLISGGLGDLGFELAGNLIKKYDAKVILLGRTELPPKMDWDDLLKSEGTNERLKKLINRLKSLECNTDKILYLKCDITNKNELSDIVSKVESKFGDINGVIHAAGVIGGRSINPILNLEREDFEIQFESKMRGVQTITNVFKDKRIDFGIVTSSLSSVLGGLEFGAYAAANIYMDYYIKYCNEQDLFTEWTSINLDGLNFENIESNLIKANEIFDVFNYAISLKCFNQIAVSTTELNSRIEKWINIKHSKSDSLDAWEDVEIEDNDIDHADLTGTEKELLKLWQSFFGKHDISITDDFFDIGGDSLKAITMIGRIHKFFNVEIPLVEFFNCTTIKELANLIDTNDWLGKMNDDSPKEGKIDIIL